MRNFIPFLALLAAVLFSACFETFDKTMLYGEWKADQFLESGEPKDIDISNLGFTFNDKNVYTYSSNLKYREAGHYRIERSVFYSTDTLKGQRIEKAVRITRVTPDSLYISMNNGGVEQDIILHKVK